MGESRASGSGPIVPPPPSAILVLRYSCPGYPRGQQPGRGMARAAGHDLLGRSGVSASPPSVKAAAAKPQRLTEVASGATTTRGSVNLARAGVKLFQQRSRPRLGLRARLLRARQLFQRPTGGTLRRPSEPRRSPSARRDTPAWLCLGMSACSASCRCRRVCVWLCVCARCVCVCVCVCVSVYVRVRACVRGHLKSCMHALGACMRAHVRLLSTHGSRAVWATIRGKTRGGSRGESIETRTWEDFERTPYHGRPQVASQPATHEGRQATAEVCAPVTVDMMTQ